MKLRIITYSFFLKDIQGLVHCYALFPVFASHFCYQVNQQRRATFIKFQLLIFCLYVHLQLILTKKWHILIIKYIHRVANWPNISCFAWVSLWTCKL